MLRFRSYVAAALIAAFAVLFACSGSSSSSGIPPITGIVIRAETLTTGRGCGTAPSQLFKYAAVVYGFGGGDPSEPTSYNVPIAAGVYDCFADGTFVELPQTGGSFTYRLEVFAYAQPAYAAVSAAVESAGTNADILRSTNPTWVTACFATQQRDVQALAVCGPLVSGTPEAQIVLQTSVFAAADRPEIACARDLDAGTDAGSDPDAATDAGEEGGIIDAGILADAAGAADAAGDAGADGAAPAGGSGFSTVRARVLIGGAEVVPATDVACPDPFIVQNALPAVRYEIDVTLLDEGGLAIGTTTCTAQTQPGVQSSATCAPVE